MVFDEWANWWHSATLAAPVLAHRLRAFAEPARGSRLPCNDLVHHDFNLSNILIDHGDVAGVVDWEAAGRGSRALDFATLLFEWHRLLQIGGTVAPEGGVRLVERIVSVAGDSGLRLVITYGAIARLALTSRRGQFAEFSVWQRAIDNLLSGPCLSTSDQAV